ELGRLRHSSSKGDLDTNAPQVRGVCVNRDSPSDWRPAILVRMFFAALLNATLAGVEPEPLVDLTQASPRSPQTEFISGMVGIGTPPLLARPICFSAGSVTRLPAVVFAG